MDSIVDNYVSIDAELQKDLEQIEAAVFTGANKVSSATIYRLKREVLEFRRAAVPLAGAADRCCTTAPARPCRRRRCACSSVTSPTTSCG